MPELPEVETLKLGLHKYLVGHKILDIDVIDKNLVEGPIEKTVSGKLTNVRRYGKGIVIDIDNGYSVAIHIKLTGQLIFRDLQTKDVPVEKPVPAPVPNKFTRAIFSLDKDSFLYFQEVRGFAWMKIVKTDKIAELPFFKSLGPEPIPSPGTETEKLTPEMLEKILSRSGQPVKVVIMDQKRIGGIGNIYANDSLFDAGIDPRRPAKSIKPEEAQKLYKSIMKVLETGMKYRGSSELNYVDALGKTGEYQNHALIYGRRNKPCKTCGTTVQKIYLGGRGTFFCTKCQK